MTCSYCGTELPQGAMFCGECGRSVMSRATPKPVVTPVTIPDDVFESGQEDVEPEAIPELIVAEEPDALQPEDLVEAIAEPEPETPPAPIVVPPTVVEAAGADELCAECGAVLAASDIFCGECGAVRASAAQARPSDTVAFDPFPWGLPAASDPIEPPTPEAPKPAQAPAAVEVESDLEPDFDVTRIVDRSPRGERFVLQFSTGESVSVSGTGLIGRNPVAEPGEYFDMTVTIVDPGKSVSKTHVEFGQEAGMFWVSDRYSGNGMVVREPEGEPRRCEAGKRYRIVRGSRVDIGEQFFIVS